VSVITLGLGIGANSAIFSLVYAAVLRPLPFAQVERLMFVSTGKTETGVFNLGTSVPELEEWKPQLGHIFEEFATAGGAHQSTWSISDRSAHLSTREVSDRFFNLLSVHPLAGRTFTSEDNTRGHGAVVVVSYRFWQEQMGGDLRALGQSLREKGGDYALYTVVGILPPEFEFDQPTDIWKPQQPLSNFLLSFRDLRRFRVIGRLKPEVRPEQAQEAMNIVAAQEAQANPASNRGWGIRVVPMREHFQAKGHLALWLLWAAVGCLLLIACVNAANLLLARSAARESEIAIRLALGSSRGRLIAQLLTESGVLALSGGLFGWLMSAWALRLLRFWGSFLLPAATLQDVVRMRPDALDPRVLAFTLAASMTAVLLFGLAPACRSTRMESNRYTRRIGMAQALVAAEVALITVLVMAAGLLVRSFTKLTAVDPGFQASDRITFDLELPGESESSPANRNRTREALWFMELERRLRSVPGVEAVGASNEFPLTDEAGGWGANIEGKLLPASTSMAHVTPGYFDAVGSPLVEGSNFSPATEMPGSKALIVNQAMARLLFPAGNAVGKHVKAPRCGIVTSSSTQPADCVIVGIARDTRFSLDTPPPPTFYYSLYQDVSERLTFVARISRHHAQMIPMVQSVIANMPAVRSDKAYLFHLQTMDDLVSQSVADPRFRSWLVSVFAGLALLLAGVGIYGVEAHAVSQRTREIGVRIALGANPARLFARIVGEAAGWTLIGIAVGLSAGLVATRLIAVFLFGVSRWDPVTLIVSPLVLLAVAVLASYVPARRAMSVDATAALRN
jgi:predicted permease